MHEIARPGLSGEAIEAYNVSGSCSEVVSVGARTGGHAVQEGAVLFGRTRKRGAGTIAVGEITFAEDGVGRTFSDATTTNEGRRPEIRKQAKAVRVRRHAA